MMVEDSRGSKRRLSDADESERLSQRQMILNMSICKMQRDNGKVEPKLLRTVLITNTVHRIEKEMEAEMLYMNNNNNHQHHHQHPDKSDAALLHSFVKSLGSTDVNWEKKESANAFSEGSSSPANLEQSFADIGLDIKPVPASNVIGKSTSDGSEHSTTPSTDDQPSLPVTALPNNNNNNRFGCIGDRRRSSPSTDSAVLNGPKESQTITDADRGAHYYLPNFILPSIFDMVDDNCMPDISALPIEADSLAAGINQFWCDDWKALPDLSIGHFGAVGGSCASEVEKFKGDSFFEDLDQIMQVLVGM